MKFTPILSLLLLACATIASAADRPNVLWITSEDNSPYLGCYGDKLASTPNLDELAKEGVRYRNAFATSPVCSATRTTLISGMYASTLGCHNHRSSNPAPTFVKAYSRYLRDAGYYCTNHTKTDYNIAGIGNGAWDGKDGNFKKHLQKQPFFAIFNLTQSHEGQFSSNNKETRLDPKVMELPPFHPDTPAMRKSWAIYYDRMSVMDAAAGKILTMLEEAGLAENTIVFYYSDHGGAMPRGKRNIHDSGTRVPMIIRFPKKWSKYAPAAPGAWVDTPVAFVDLPPTLLSLAGVPIPKHFQGKPFLGPEAKKAEREDFVYLVRDRMDARYDCVRAIRTKDYLYVRNFAPHRSWGQFYTYPMQVQPSMREWYAQYKAGNCNAAQSRYWQEKPGEELYKIADDPFQMNNLADDSEYAAKLVEMRKKLNGKLLATRDAGLIPEALYGAMRGEKTLYDYAQSEKYPLEKILQLACRASDRDVKNLPEFQKALTDANPVVRYWGAVGCVILKKEAAPAKEALLKLLNDKYLAVQVTAAEALTYLGEKKLALEALGRGLQGGEYDQMTAVNNLDFAYEAGNLTLAEVKGLLQGKKIGKTPSRISRYLLGLQEKK